MKCLILNQDFTALSICSWQKALILILLNKAEVIKNYNKSIYDTSRRAYSIPAVIRLPKYVKRKHSLIQFSKRTVFLRDKYKCCYCNSNKKLTYDHIIPRSRWNYNNGSPTKWTNVVTACITCNGKKGNRTPEEADMKLLHKPFIPKFGDIPLGINFRNKKIPKEWQEYIYAIL